ncbi:MAG: Rho termination factor N-terminal domain-containing protein [Cetobacterium sp.]
MSKVDLIKLKVAELKVMCKERSITGYSKLKKPELIDVLIKDGVVNASSDETASSTKSSKSDKTTKVDKTPVKPPAVKMSTKLKRYVQLDSYKEELLECVVDVNDGDILAIFESVITEFIDNDELHTTDDYVKYINEYKKYGQYEALVSFNSDNKIKELFKGGVDHYYKTLARFIYPNDTDVTSGLVKAARAYIEKAAKQAAKQAEKEEKAKSKEGSSSKGKEVKKSKAKKIEEPEESESESEQDNNDPKDLDYVCSDQEDSD